MKKFFLTALMAAALCFAAGNVGNAQEAGGTRVAVTQATSVTTGVTANGSSGVITTFTQTAASGVGVTFTVTNPAVVAANNVVLAGVVNYAGTGTPVARVNNIVAGAFDVVITNVHASAALNAVVKVGFIVQ